MLRRIDDFLKVWEEEADKTLKIFRTLNDAALSQKITPESRSLGKLAWHLAVSLNMVTEAGLPVEAPADDNAVPARVQDIFAAYERGAASVRERVSAKWSDAALLEIVPMYGEQWAKGYVLWALILHQTHHRAQMTVLMRQAGLKVPGAYGPAREEWVEMNLQAPE